MAEFERFPSPGLRQRAAPRSWQQAAAGDDDEEDKPAGGAGAGVGAGAEAATGAMSAGAASLPAEPHRQGRAVASSATAAAAAAAAASGRGWGGGGGSAATAVSAFAPAPAAAVPFSFDGLVEKYEKLVPLAILMAAAFTRFYRLSEPNGVNFDESHFIRFTNQYTARTYFFDIHPPLGKLMLWFVGQLVGLNSPSPSTRPFMSLPTDCNYEHISEDFVPGCKYAYLRTVAATHSMLTVVMLYFVARNWGATVWGGILASGLLLFDMLNNIQGRLVLLDVQLSFWCVAALLVSQYWWRRLNEHYEAEDRAESPDSVPPPAPPASGGVLGFLSRCMDALLPPPAPPQLQLQQPQQLQQAAGWLAPQPRLMTAMDRNMWCLGVGFVCANAFSVKMTGAVTPFVVAVESFFGLWFLKRGAPFLDLLKILFVGAMTYAFWFAVHFAILTRHGDGDEEFMTQRFQSTLLESKHYDPAARWEGFWWTFYTLNKRMIVHNANILAPHPWMSSWSEWVLNLRGVAYYGKDLKDTYTAAVYLIGNHALHLLVIAGLVLFLAFVALHLRVRPFAKRLQGLGHAVAAAPPSLSLFFASGSFCLVAYCLNLLPYLGVARSTFIYHYMPALIYGELLLARVVEHLAGRQTPNAARAVLLVVGLVWMHYTPWIYGFPLTNDAHQRRRWNPRWD